MILIKTMLFWGLALLLYLSIKKHIQNPCHKRYLLLGIVIGGLLLNAPLPHFFSANDALFSLSLPVIESTSAIEDSAHDTALSLVFGWYLIYCSGVIFFSLVFIKELASLIVSIRNSKRQADYFLLAGSRDIFSFLGMIFIGDQVQLKEDELQMALLHERQHIQRVHSFDILLISLLQIIFWFFSIWPWLKKELQLVHELEADQKVLIKYNAHQYAGLLVRLSTRGSLSSVHYFAQSLTKKRLQAMIYNNQSSMIKPILGALLLGCLWLFVACVEEQDVPAEKADESALSKTSQIQGDEDEVYKVVDKMPVLETCQNVEKPTGCLIQKFYSYVTYPETARKNGEKGTSVVSFIVEKDGSFSDVTVVRKLSTALDKAALNAVERLAEDHRWIPGSHNGEKVRVQYNLPIKFKLSDED